MRILAIDSCSMVATGAIMTDDILTAEFVINDKKTHSVKLLPQIENMVKSVDITFSDIDYFACTTGPGSFTGQRIGVATVKALAHATKKPVVGLSALECMAYNISPCDFLICPIMDARRDQVYTATYKWDNGEIITSENDRAIAITDLLEEFSDRKVIFLGDGVPVFNQEILGKLGETANFAPANLLQLRGGSVAMCAKKYIMQGKACDYDALQPTYLRLSQAEREYNDRIR